MLPLIMLGATALGSWLSNRNKNKATQEQKSTSSFNNTSTTAPTTLAPEYSGMQNAIMPMIMKRLQSNSLPAGYEVNGIKDINRTYDLGKQSIDNNLTARGLGSSPIAGAAGTRLETGRLGTIADMQTNLPLVQRDLQNQDLAMAMQQLEFGRSMAGRSTTNTGTGGSDGTTTAQTGGGGWGAVAGDSLTMLMHLIGSGAFNKGGKATGGMGAGPF